MEDLPEQALIGMMHMLEPNDLAALACACRRLHSISLMVDGKDGRATLKWHAQLAASMRAIASGQWKDSLVLAAAAPDQGRTRNISFGTFSFTPTSAKANASVLVAGGRCQAFLGAQPPEAEGTVLQLLHGHIRPQTSAKASAAADALKELSLTFLDAPSGAPSQPSATGGTAVFAAIPHLLPATCSVVLQPCLPRQLVNDSPHWPPPGPYQHPFAIPHDILQPGRGGSVALAVPCALPAATPDLVASGSAASMFDEPLVVAARRCEQVVKFLTQSPGHLRNATYLDLSGLAISAQYLLSLLSKCGTRLKMLAARATHLSPPILQACSEGLLHITHLDLSFSLSGKSLPIPGTSSGDIALASQVKLRPAAQFAEELRSAIAKLHSLQVLCLTGNNLDGWLGGIAGPEQLHRPSAVQHLQCLHTLDISYCTGVTAQQVVELMTCCRRLRKLLACGCKSLAEAGGTEKMADLLSTLAASGDDLPDDAPRLPSLTHIAVGWGFNGASLRNALCSSQHSLVSLEVSVGATLTDHGLAKIAQQHPLLETVRLSMAAISDTGVSALLWACRRLHRLALVECVGPFTPAMLTAAPGLCSSCSAAATPELSPGVPPVPQGSPLPSSSPSCRGRCVLQHNRWRMTELQLRGGNISLTNNDLNALIGVPAAKGQGSGGLHTLALSGLPLVSDAFLWYLGRQHANSLRHLKLERCGSAPRSHSVGPSPACGLGLSEAGLLELLALCRGLRSLSLRRCCQLTSSFEEAVRQCCPLLEHLDVEHGTVGGNRPYALQQLEVMG